MLYKYDEYYTIHRIDRDTLLILIRPSIVIYSIHLNWFHIFFFFFCIPMVWCGDPPKSHWTMYNYCAKLNRNKIIIIIIIYQWLSYHRAGCCFWSEFLGCTDNHGKLCSKSLCNNAIDLNLDVRNLIWVDHSKFRLENFYIEMLQFLR